MADLTGKSNRAVFFDRDGTINVEKNYLYRIKDFQFISGVPQALKNLQDAGFLLVMVTNQSGIARGYFTAGDVRLLHEYMCLELKRYQVNIDGIYFCPHHPEDECNCRKGKPGMILQAADDLEIDLSRSFMIGDKLSDIEAGTSAGCRSFLITTGYGETGESATRKQGEVVFDDLPSVVDCILTQGDLRPRRRHQLGSIRWKPS